MEHCTQFKVPMAENHASVKKKRLDVLEVVWGSFAAVTWFRTWTILKLDAQHIYSKAEHKHSRLNLNSTIANRRLIPLIAFYSKERTFEPRCESKINGSRLHSDVSRNKVAVYKTEARSNTILTRFSHENKNNPKDKMLSELLIDFNTLNDSQPLVLCIVNKRLTRQISTSLQECQQHSACISPWAGKT